jgi:hypothetical protein
MSSNMHILANLNPDPEKNTFENLPPFYAGCPKDINVTVPEQKQWVEDFKNGKFGTLTDVQQKTSNLTRYPQMNP